MYHYTYLIKHKRSKQKYIGVRSSKYPPLQDDYWGSSKHLPKDVKQTHKKRILQIFLSREEALLHEIYLHDKYNVGVNSEFYNRSKQTSTKYDTSGITKPHSDDTKVKIGKANKGKIRTPEMVEAMRIRMQGTKQPLSTIQKRVDTRIKNGKNRGIEASHFRPWYISTETVTYLFYNTTKSAQSVIDGHYSKYYADLMKKQNKTKSTINTVQYGLIRIGDIPT